MQQAVILVGGRGTRLGSLAGGRPKPFLDIGGKPFLDYLITHAKCHGVERVVLLAGHAASWISENYECSVPGVEVILKVEADPMGTAGALLSAADVLDETFLLLNGDSILNGNWSVLAPLLGEQDAASLAVRQVGDVSRFGAVTLNGNTVSAFGEKQLSGPGLINAGIYLLRRDKALALIEGPCSLEVDILPKLVEKGLVKAHQVGGYFLDIGLPETLSLARKELVQALKRKAVFFDRDNTLVEDNGYTHKPEDLVWKDGALQAIKAANDAGYGVFVVTNQAGIARGYYDEAAMNKFHRAMQADLRKIGAHIDQFYHCPHHPEGVIDGLGQECSCRKPATGMLEQAFSQHALHIEGSFMIGDMMKDVACGESFGLASRLYEGGSLLDLCKQMGILN